MSIKTLTRVAQHIPVGLLTVFLVHISWPLGAIFAAGFLVYELMEFVRLRVDKGWWDVMGWLIGLGIGGGVLFGLRCMGEA